MKEIHVTKWRMRRGYRDEMACAELTVSEQSFLQQNIFQTIAQIRSNNKCPDLKSIDSYLAKIEKLKEISVKYLQQTILQLEDEGKLVNKKSKGADSFFTTETKSIPDPPQSPNLFFPVTQDTPLTTPSPDKTSNLQMELHELRTEVVAMKSFISEQLLLIKQNQNLVNEQSISDYENNSELLKSILDQTEYLRRENSAKSNISLLNNKVLFKNEGNLSSIDKSNFENPKRDVKSKIMAENRTKSNNVVSPNQFSCLNNYGQFENSTDFNKEIAQVSS